MMILGLKANTQKNKVGNPGKRCRVRASMRSNALVSFLDAADPHFYQAPLALNPSLLGCENKSATFAPKLALGF